MPLSTSNLLITDKIKELRPTINNIIDEFTDFTLSDSSLIFDGTIEETDETIIVNSGEVQNGSIGKLPGIEIDRGNLTNQTLVFDESDDTWKVGEKGGSLTALSLSGHTHTEYLNKDGSVPLEGNIELGLNYINNDGTNNGLSFDISNNGIFSNDLSVDNNLTVTNDLTVIGTSNMTDVILENSTTPTGIELYNTYTDVDTYEKGFVKFETDILKIGVSQEDSTLPEIGLVQNGITKIYNYNNSIDDDGIIQLPSITTSAFGWVTVGVDEERSLFTITSTGTVTLMNNSANIDFNADTDSKFCIGTALLQTPISIKNRLGSAKICNLMLWYN